MNQTAQTADQTQDFSLENNPLNEIKRTIAVISGKGGVGKSLVTALLATYLARSGKYRVGVMDADITGPSIPKLFGVDDANPKMTDAGIFPVRTHSDIQVMSINLLLDNPDAPVIWRGPILANTVKQFWTDVIWGDLDFLFLDMPPGTGDVPLTVFQSIPLEGIIIVTSPQDLVSMIVKKAVNMANMMNIPIIGMVENMREAVCPHCGESIKIFGDSKAEQTAAEWKIPYLGSLPVDPDLALLCDRGEIERIHKPYLTEAIQTLEKKAGQMPASGQQQEQEASMNQQKTNKIAVASDGKFISQHFGHCEGFKVYVEEDGRVASQTFIQNPGHKPGLLPNLLNDEGVSVVIAGGMGAGAIEIFNDKGIDVITGATGEADQAIDLYLSGKLLSTGSVCQEHGHAGDCGSH